MYHHLNPESSSDMDRACVTSVYVTISYCTVYQCLSMNIYILCMLGEHLTSSLVLLGSVLQEGILVCTIVWLVSFAFSKRREQGQFVKSTRS